MPCTGLTEVSTKILAATGGFLGGTSMLMYMRPPNMQDALRRIVISTLSAVMLSSIVSREVFNTEGSEMIMGTSFCIGFLAWSILGAVAKFFQGRQDQDIVQMMKAVNEARSPSPAPYYTIRPQPISRQVDNPDE